MNDTISLYEKCDHDRLEPHLMQKKKHRVVCPGGREIVLRQEHQPEYVKHDGTFLWYVNTGPKDTVWVGCKCDDEAGVDDE